MIVFVCSPYRASSESQLREHVMVALQACRELVTAGHVPLAPHLIFPRFLADDVPGERRDGIRCGLALLERCDALLVRPNANGVSEGMATEIRHAHARKIPVVQSIASLPR